jgi:hypothetical protein
MMMPKTHPYPLPALGQRKAVGVIFNADCASQPLLNVLLQRFADQAGCVGIVYQAGWCVNGAGNADTDSAGPVRRHLPGGLVDHCADEIENSLITTVARRRFAAAQHRASFRTQEKRFGLGAAQINADAKAHVPVACCVFARVAACDYSPRAFDAIDRGNNDAIAAV